MLSLMKMAKSYIVNECVHLCCDTFIMKVTINKTVE